MPNQLYEITSASPEHKHLTREWTLVELGLHQAAEADKPSAESSAKAFKGVANEPGIDGAFNADQCTARNLNVHRQVRGQSPVLFRLRGRWSIVADGDRKKLNTSRRLGASVFAQLTGAVLLAPVE